MNTRISLIAALLSTLAAGTASAQQGPEIEAQTSPTKRMDLQASVALPVGDAADVLDTGFGVLFQYARLIQPQLAITGRSGLLYQSGGAGEVTLLHVPALAGVEYSLAPRHVAHAYLSAELGLVYLHGSVDTGFGRVSDSEVELGASVGAGYRFGGMDVRGQIYIPSMDEIDDTLHLMVTAGWTLSQR